MVDAQAPGVARRVRDLAYVTQSSADWTERLLEQIGSLFLLIKAYRRIESLTAATQADIRTAVGWTFKEEELPTENVVRDEWFVLGQRVTGEEALRVHRTWLWGRQTKQGALILEFAAGGQQFVPTFISGTCIVADLTFYPGNFPLRAVVKSQNETTQPSNGFSGYSHVNELLLSYADGLARNPWLETIPVSLDLIVPITRGDRWFAKDANQNLIPLSSQTNDGWQLTALSGGHPISIMGEWNGRVLLPLGVRAEGRYVEL
jgi:hypothetical protein